MEDQDKSLEVDNIYGSIQEDVSSSLHWFLLLHLSLHKISERTKQTEAVKHRISTSSLILTFICIS